MTAPALSQEQVDRAYRLFYGDGQSLGEIAEALGCGIYALSPWLYAPQRRIITAACASRDEHVESLIQTTERMAGEAAELRMKIKRLQKKVKAAKGAK